MRQERSHRKEFEFWCIGQQMHAQRRECFLIYRIRKNIFREIVMRCILLNIQNLYKMLWTFVGIRALLVRILISLDRYLHSGLTIPNSLYRLTMPNGENISLFRPQWMRWSSACDQQSISSPSGDARKYKCYSLPVSSLHPEVQVLER